MKRFILTLIASMVVLTSTVAAAPMKVSSNLIYSWWTHPIATQDSNGNVFYGGVTSSGGWRTFKKEPGDTTIAEIQNNIVATAPEADDHNAPSMLVKEGKPTLLFYTRHTMSNVLNYERAPAGTIDFVDQGNITFPQGIAYSQILNEGDRVVVITRVGQCKWGYILSDDYGITWSPPATLIDACSDINHKLYVLTSDSVNEPIVIAPHPGEDNWKNIAYGELDVSSGEVTSSEGVVGDLDAGQPISKPDLDEVNPNQSPDQKTRLLEVGEVNDKPVMFYAKWGNSFAPRYYSAIQEADGTFTRTYLGISAGESFWASGEQEYVGGIAYNSTNEMAYIAYNTGTSNKTWYIKRYPVNADGTVGTATTVASDPTYPIVRPYLVKNSDRILYQRLINYDSFKVFNSQLYLTE